MAQHYVYQFYTELKGFKPKIWRRFEIAGSKTMAELGYTLMVLFEMEASHLFCFTENRQKSFYKNLMKTYGEKHVKNFLRKHEIDEYSSKVKYEIDMGEGLWTSPNENTYEADKIKLSQITDMVGWELEFNYDYGDDWNIKVILEKCEKREVSLTMLPNVIDGAGFGIIEDIGGINSLENFVRVMKKGKGEEFEELSEWYGITDFDINHFDKDDLNFRLKKLIRVYRECYEYNYEPTQRSIDILERKYMK